ncbi:MAG: FAD-binding protein [Candidatus Thermoplasmatota archaeon]|nr:FAD-binding protein [Candidatus Thermoplasmatota archaeon]
MESWNLVIVGSGPAALRAAIAAADAGTTPLLLESSGIGAGSAGSDIAGLAASIDEVSSSGHRDDTISAGGESTDKVAAARVCGEAVNVLAELERWGLVLRRREGGLPHATQIAGHSMPRMTGCGDATGRNITRILEEQAMKRGVIRRSDILAMSLVMDGKQVRGLTAYDTNSGVVIGIQSKAVILATSGHQGIWTSPSAGSGLGSSLLASAGLSLVGMENNPTHPLTVRGTDLNISLDVLGSGGRVRKSNGEDVDPSEVGEDDCILDLRGLDSDAKAWFANTRTRVKDRTGLDISREVVPITTSIATTTGGAPVDEHGRVTFSKGKKWATGLYAAGRSANNGMHGEGMLAGNIILDDIVGGGNAGSHAGAWAQEASFGGSTLVEKAITTSSKRLELLKKGDGASVGQASATLASVMSSCTNGSRDESSLKSAADAIAEMRDTGIKVTDQSSVMNTEMCSALKLQGMITLAEQITKS